MDDTESSDSAVIDFRSDTVTRPSAAMRRAMAEAEVGDDVYGEDPTVNRLQRRAAELFGKEAALFVPSGTMGNQICIRVLTRHGDVVLAATDAHCLRYEAGAAAAISGVQVRTIGAAGVFGPADVHAAIPPADAHFAPATLVTVENTHNAAGGRIFPFDALVEVAGEARERGLRLHLDGARIFNAVIASGVPAADWARHFDTVSFCLSKGLGAPVGSLVCGTADVVSRAHRIRKMLGGGMRQAGILAAAGLHALEHNVDRLGDDHDNARRLAAGLRFLGAAVAPEPETNIVLFRVPAAAAVHAGARERGVLFNRIGEDAFRAVTHLDVSADDVDDALDRLRPVLDGVGRHGSRG